MRGETSRKHEAGRKQKEVQTDQTERKCGGISECLDALATTMRGIKENATPIWLSDP